MGLFKNSRELQFGMSKLAQKHRQVPQTRKRNVTVWRRRWNLEGVVLKERPLEKGRRSSGPMRGSHGHAAGVAQLPWEIMCIVSLGL